MKISCNWLKQYHDLDLEPDKVAEFLTGCGLEVEAMETFHSVKGGLKGVVVGEVLTCEKHPNSDHLSLTTVHIGSDTPLHIVCGAPNVAKGQKVAVATIGTTLYFGEKELTLQRTRIRGEVSEGMICAEDELGLGPSHDGILVLDPAAPVGLPAAAWFEVEEDTVLTLGLTPNRVDAASHLGVARDLVAVVNNFGRDSADAALAGHLRVPGVEAFTVDHDRRHIRVTIEDPVACPRYTGITVSGIRVAESPGWLKNRLLAVGLRPINNIVDITNYILMELGHPLHAFDADQIAGDHVIIRKYPEGTRFVTLDHVERTLTANDLMICNASEPMCIAGVFGGIKSGVTTATTSIFLESACFDPKHIRRTSRHHGLQTDASFRFERGADPGITVYALQRAAAMIREIAGGEISSAIVDEYPVPFAQPAVILSFERLDRLVGKTIQRQVVRAILLDLGFTITRETEDGTGLELRVPGAKVDVTREADVIEEVLRVYGYNNIPVHDRLLSSLSYTREPDPGKVQNLCADFLASHGFHEVVNNSLTPSGWYEGHPGFPSDRGVRMLNPISRDLDMMRQTLAFGMLDCLVFNHNRKQYDLKFFEFGKVYATTPACSSADPLPGYHEEVRLAMALTGRLQPESWNTHDRPAGLFDLKGYLEGVFIRLGIDLKSLQSLPFRSDFIHEGLQYQVAGNTFAWFGSVAAGAMGQFDCKLPVYYAEVKWESLLALIPAKNSLYRELPRFPEVRRDLALLVGREVTFAQIVQTALAADRKLLKQVGLFDVYEGGKIPEGKKSYAVYFYLQDESKTLTDKEIEKSMERIIRALSAELDAQIRT